MNELGHALRESRESQGFSLAEAEDRTRIRQKFIAAMETEDWDALPGDVPTRGFLRKYATFLGLNPEEVVDHYQRRANATAVQSDESQVPSERPIDYRPIELELAEEPPRRIPWRGVVVLLALVGVVAVGWWIYAFRPAWFSSLVALPQNLPQPADLVALEPTATATPGEQSNRVTATPTDTAEPVAEVTPEPAVVAGTTEPVNVDPAVEPAEPAETISADVAPAASDVMRLQLNLLARSWIRLLIDGQVITESVMEQGDGGDWEATESIVLRTGNAAGVKVTLNDEDLPFLGGPGEVIERRWDLVNGEIVETSPTPIPSPLPTATPGDAPTETPTP